MENDTDAPPGDPFLDDSEAMMKLAQQSFARAAREAVAENDRLGIPSPGGLNGQIVWRFPPQVP